MVTLGERNSRMKDYFDVWLLSQRFDFQGDRLAQAIAATFARRKTAILTDIPGGLSSRPRRGPRKEHAMEGFLAEGSSDGTNSELRGSRRGCARIPNPGGHAGESSEPLARAMVQRRAMAPRTTRVDVSSELIKTDKNFVFKFRP